MTDMQFTKEEVSLLKLYASLKNDNRTFAHRLAVEIIPPVGFIATYFVTGHIIYCIGLVVAMSFFNVFRIVKQRRSIEMLRSVAVKALHISNSAEIDQSSSNRNNA